MIKTDIFCFDWTLTPSLTHVFSAVEFFFDMLSLEMSQTSRKKFGVNPYSGYDFV